MTKIRKNLIDITYEMIYKNGSCDVKINDILKRAKITKGAMYHYFNSKEDLIQVSMSYHLENILMEHWIEPFQENEEPIQTLIQQIELYKSMYMDENCYLDIRYGCPLSNLRTTESNISINYLNSIYRSWQESIEDVLFKAKHLQQISSNVNIKSQSIYIVSFLEGFIGYAKTSNNQDILEIGFSFLIDHLNNL